MKIKHLPIKFIISLIFLIIYGLFFISTNVRANSDACYDFESCAPRDIVLTCFEKSPNGCIDWEHRIIYAVGIGVPNTNLQTAAQKNFSAVRAATVVAQRNLLEMIQGVQINSNTTVEMGMAENDTIVSTINGTVKRVQPIGNPAFLNDGSVAVTVRYFMDDLSTLLVSRNPYSSNNSGASGKIKNPYGKKSDANFETGTGGNRPNSDGSYTGLILNAKGLGIKPALSPKVYDEKGNEIYGFEKTDRDFNLKQGIAGYAKSVESAKNNSRIKGNVLEMKVKKLSGSSGVDMVLANQDGEKLINLYETQSFLREGRVIVLVD